MIPMRLSRFTLALALALILSPLVAARRDDAATRLEISQLLARIDAAVTAADVDSYLACVDRSDPVFGKEQENWAADLKRHTPATFTLALAPEGLAVGDGSAECAVTAAWTMNAGQATPRTVTFPARFTHADTGWLFAGERWRVIKAEGLRVLHEPGLEETARAVVEVFPEVRAHVHEGFELVVGHEQVVKLYTSMDHLQFSIYPSYEDSLGGWNEPGESIKILARARTGKGELRILLGHEYGHVATFEMGPKSNEMPWWVLEGVAELSAERYYGGPERVDNLVRGWAAAGQIVEWERLADFRGEAQNHMIQVYKQGQHMLGYISQRFGRTKRNAWLRSMSAGATIDEASQQAFGLTFAALDAQWRESLTEEAPEKPAKEPAEGPAPAGAR